MYLILALKSKMRSQGTVFLQERLLIATVNSAEEPAWRTGAGGPRELVVVMPHLHWKQRNNKKFGPTVHQNWYSFWMYQTYLIALMTSWVSETIVLCVFTHIYLHIFDFTGVLSFLSIYRPILPAYCNNSEMPCFSKHLHCVVQKSCIQRHSLDITLFWQRCPMAGSLEVFLRCDTHFRRTLLLVLCN